MKPPQVELACDLWVAIHADKVISGVGAATVTMPMAESKIYSTGQGWGFTYVNVTVLPQTFDIISNGKLHGNAVLSMNANGFLVITFADNVKLTGGGKIHVAVSNTESNISGLGPPGQYGNTYTPNGSTLVTGIYLLDLLKKRKERG